MHVLIFLFLVFIASLGQITFALIPTDKTMNTTETQLLATIALLQQRVQSLELQLKTQSSGNGTKASTSKSTKAARFFSAANALGLDTSILSTKKKDRKSKAKDTSVVNATVSATTTNVTVAGKTVTKADAVITSSTSIATPTKPSNPTPPKTASIPSVTTGSSTINTRTMTKNGKTLLVPRTIDDFNGPSPHEKKLFYMYEMDESFWWRWPDPKADCSQNGYLDHPHALLSGVTSITKLLHVSCKYIHACFLLV